MEYSGISEKFGVVEALSGSEGVRDGMLRVGEE